jgi:hypothetical protein
MARNPRPAVLYLRLSPQLREGLRQAPDRAGCSLNAFSVLVLAAAAGDPTHFRAPAPEDAEPDVRDLERDALGFPLGAKENWRHSIARNEFMGAMESQMPTKEWVALVKEYDANDPGYFVEWQRLTQIEREGRESADRRGAA